MRHSHKIFPPKNVFSAPQVTSQQLELHCSSQLLPGSDCLDYNSLAPDPARIDQPPFCFDSATEKQLSLMYYFFLSRARGARGELGAVECIPMILIADISLEYGW